MQQPSEVTGLPYLIPSNPSPFPSHSGMITTQNNNNNMLTTYQTNRINGNYMINHPLYNTIQEISPQSSGFSSNSTSDEADEQQQSIINERKHRRMISNRESARRSRMRKQKHLGELWSQVVSLRNENHQLIDKLNHVSECIDKAVQENSQLKEEAIELRQMIADMKLSSPYSAFEDLEDI